MQNVKSFFWLLPAATVVFVAYIVFAVVGLAVYDLSVLPVLLLVILPLSLTVVAQVVALLDLFARPKDLLSDEAKMVWAMFLLIVGPLAFAPYWLLVARRPAPGAR